MKIKLTGPKIKAPRIKLTYTCGICKRQVQYNKPHKCRGRKPR